MDILKLLKNEIIVSIQAMPNEPLYNVVCINGYVAFILVLHCYKGSGCVYTVAP